MNPITFQNKEAYSSGAIAIINKVLATDINAIKASINEAVAQIGNYSIGQNLKKADIPEFAGLIITSAGEAENYITRASNGVLQFFTISAMKTKLGIAALESSVAALEASVAAGLEFWKIPVGITYPITRDSATQFTLGGQDVRSWSGQSILFNGTEYNFVESVAYSTNSVITISGVGVPATITSIKININTRDQKAGGVFQNAALNIVPTVDFFGAEINTSPIFTNDSGRIVSISAYSNGTTVGDNPNGAKLNFYIDTQNSGTLASGSRYVILSNSGATFTSSGASSNTVGTVFTANATPPTWGTGSVGKCILKTDLAIASGSIANCGATIDTLVQTIYGKQTVKCVLQTASGSNLIKGGFVLIQMINT